MKQISALKATRKKEKRQMKKSHIDKEIPRVMFMRMKYPLPLLSSRGLILIIW